MVANRADLKLAILSILLTTSNETDLTTLFNLALHLNRRRNRERAAQVRLSFDRDDT